MSHQPRTLPFYLGGFLGPLGTAVMVPMVPELRDAFDVSTEAVNWGYVAYILPFSVLLIVSGTIGERYGRRRVLISTYVGFAVASLLCAISTELWTFLVGRAMQGVANAFVTPLLIAGLAEVVRSERLGRSVGFYSSMQALGSAFGPYLGGVAADTNWRLAFVGVAIASLILVPFAPPGEPRPDTEQTPIRPLMSPRMVWFGVAVMFAAAGPLGASVLIGIKARDELGITGSAAGTLLLTGSLIAMVLGPVWGRVLDRYGPRATGAVSVGIVSLISGSIAWADTTTLLTLNWMFLGALTPIVVITFQSVGAVAVPENRAGGLSMILAWRFLGHGLGPLIFVPMWIVAPKAAFVIAASLGLVTMVGFLTEPDRKSPTPA